MGALLVPGCGSMGAGSMCVDWWGWDPVEFPQEGPPAPLRPVPAGHLTAYPWTYLYLVYLPLAARHLPTPSGIQCCLQGLPRVSLNCSSGPALPLPMPVNVAAVMPTGRWDGSFLMVFAWSAHSVQIN